MAKLVTQRAVLEIADQALQIHGGYGYMREYGIERAVRDARLGPIGGGTDEIMKEILGKRWGCSPGDQAGLAAIFAVGRATSAVAEKSCMKTARPLCRAVTSPWLAAPTTITVR